MLATLANRIFPSEVTALRPRLACEITSAGVVAARPGATEHDLVSSFVPIRQGLLEANLKSANFLDRASIAVALRQALDEIKVRETKLTVVIPDASVRVLVLDFDVLPAKAAEAIPIIRFRLRKLVPFEMDDAAVSYQLMPSAPGTVRAVVATCPAAIQEEYESAVREAGYEPGVVLPSTLAALGAVTTDEPALIVNRNGHSITTAIIRANELLLYRSLELAEKDWLPDGYQSAEELQQSVSVAMAYFEDTLETAPRHLLSCGLGGSQELARLLGEDQTLVRDLVPTPFSTKAMPAGILAGVVGALAS